MMANFIEICFEDKGMFWLLESKIYISICAWDRKLCHPKLKEFNNNIKTYMSFLLSIQFVIC